MLVFIDCKVEHFDACCNLKILHFNLCCGGFLIFILTLERLKVLLFLHRQEIVSVIEMYYSA